MAPVQIWSLGSRLLAILAVASFLLAPAAASYGAATGDDGHMSLMGDMVSMSDTMPCCADQNSAVPDHPKSCLTCVLCVSTCFPAASAGAVFTLASFVVEGVSIPGHDSWRDLLPDPPPPKPPRA
jgi:hypothetical protein